MIIFDLIQICLPPPIFLWELDVTFLFGMLDWLVVLSITDIFIDW